MLNTAIMFVQMLKKGLLSTFVDIIFIMGEERGNKIIYNRKDCKVHDPPKVSLRLEIQLQNFLSRVNQLFLNKRANQMYLHSFGENSL